MVKAMTKSRDELRAALSHPNVAAFLRVIRQGESRQDDSAYTIQFGGEHFEAPPWEHPGTVKIVGSLRSTAAGAYQFLKSTWDAVRSAYELPDFSPACQDEAAVALIKGRKALDDVIAGRFKDAVVKCAKEWASLPFSPYGQPTLTYDLALKTYQAWGGRLEEAAPPAEEPTFNPDSLETEHYGDTPMAPIVLPLLQIAAQFIPQLAEKFGSGSEVSNRNLAAGKVIADAITTATQSPNLQAAIEQMQKNPEAVQAAKEAVAVQYAELFEVGGGLAAARKASTDTEGDWRKVFVSLPFVVIVMLMPMVYFVVFHVITGTDWSQEIKASVVSAVISGVLFAIVGYALGTSYGSSRKTNMLAGRE